ncbi:MAG: hypothetical protein JTJ18_07980, partial [Streptococcus sp.]|nr:hypothetical protein [Streptococcus sp.]
IEEVHQLLHRRVELSDDVLHGKHHTECHLPMNHGSCSDYRDDDVLLEILLIVRNVLITNAK